MLQTAAAQKAFVSICLALEAETLQGETSKQVVDCAKVLVQIAGLNAPELLSHLSPESQGTVRAYFA